MNKILIALVLLMCLVGCDEETEVVSEQEWKKTSLLCLKLGYGAALARKKKELRDDKRFVLKGILEETKALKDME